MKTAIPPQNIPFIDGRGYVSREWYLYLLNRDEKLGGKDGDTTIPDLSNEITAIESNIDLVESDIAAIEAVNTAQDAQIVILQADVAQGGADIADLQSDVSGLQTSKEDVTNKVTSWQSPTTDTNYPSEKLVRDTILPLEPATYYPASMTVSAGTLDTGTYTDLAALGGTDVNISEATGASPLTVVFGFTGVTKLSGFVFYGRYSGGAGHQMLIEAYNYTLTSWDQLGVIGTDTSKRWYSFPIFSPADYMSGGAAQIRFSHVQNGINTHDMIFDLVALYFGALSGQSSISSASVVFTPSGNISATNVGSALMELDSEKQATLVSGSNIRTVNGQTLLGSSDLVVSGSTTVTQVEVDFGSTGKWSEDFTIADASVTGASKIVASVAALSTTDNDADEIAASGVVAVPGTPAIGTFAMSVFATDGPVSGKFKINYIVG